MGDFARIGRKNEDTISHRRFHIQERNAINLKTQTLSFAVNAAIFQVEISNDCYLKSLKLEFKGGY